MFTYRVYWIDVFLYECKTRKEAVAKVEEWCNDCTAKNAKDPENYKILRLEKNRKRQ